MKEEHSLVELASDITRKAPSAARRYLLGRAWQSARGLAARLGFDLRTEADATAARELAQQQGDAARVVAAQLELERARADFVQEKLEIVTGFLNPNPKVERRA